MAFEHGRNSDPERDPVVIWMRRMAKIQRRLRRAEVSLEQAASDLDQLIDDVETGSTPVPAAGVGKSLREPLHLPLATWFAVTASDTVTFVVHGVDARVELNRVQMDLIALLKTPSKESADGLVGFKTTASLVHALRLRGRNATRRSVTVEVSRLREALGPANRYLIENRRGLGYRFRLLRSAATLGREAAE